MTADIEKRVRIVTESIVTGEDKLKGLQDKYNDVSKNILRLSKSLTVSNKTTKAARSEQEDLVEKLGKYSNYLLKTAVRSKSYRATMKNISETKNRIKATEDVIKAENKQRASIQENINKLKQERSEISLSQKQLRQSITANKKELKGLKDSQSDGANSSMLYTEGFKGLGGILNTNIPRFKSLLKTYNGLSKEEKQRVPLLNRTAISLKKATHGTNRFRMELLGAMFFGMSLQKSMTNLISTSLDWMGVTEEISATLGDFFLPVAEKILDVVIFLSDILGGFSDRFKLLIGLVVVGTLVFGATVAILAQFLLGIGSLLLAVSLFAPAIISSGVAVGALGGASFSALTPLATLSAIMMGGVPAATGFTAATTTATAATGTFTATLWGLVTAIAAVVGWILLAVLAVVALALLAYLIVKNWDNIKDYFSNLWKKIKEIFQSSIKWITVAILAMVAPWALLIYTVIKNWDKIKDYFRSMWGGIKTSFKSGLDYLSDMLMKFNPTNWLQEVGNTMRDWFAGLFGGDDEEDESLGDKLKSKWTNLLDGIGNVLSDGGDFIKKWLWDKPIEWAGKGVDWIKDKWRPISESISDSLEAAGPFLKTWLWDKPGEWAGNGAEWIKEKWNSLKSPAGDIFSSIGNFFKIWFWDKPIEWVSGTVNWIIEKWNIMRNSTGQIFSSIGNFFKTWFWDKPREWLDSLWNKVSDIWSKIAKKVSETPLIGSTVKFVGNLLGSFQSGGIIPQTGPYLLHKGEEVIPANQVNNYRGATPQYNITVNANVSSSYDVRNLAEEIKRYLSLDYDKAYMGR